MRIAKQTFIIFSGIAASFSTASSFGTQSSRSFASRQHMRQNIVGDPLARQIRRGFLNVRGGSDTAPDSNPSSPVTELAAEAQSTSKSEPEPVPVPEPAAEAASAPAETKAVAQIGMGPNSTPPGTLRSWFPKFPWYTLPNQLTYARCVAIPALIVQFYMSNHPQKNLHSSLIFAIASITDYLDGYLARRWDICSPFGAFLDPVADKLMVSTALILLAGKYGAVVAIPSAIILAREIAVSALREWMASRGARDSVKVGFQGKCKTALTMASLTVILAVPDGWSVATALQKAAGWDLVMNTGMAMLFMSAFVTITSGSVYFRAAAPVLMGSK